MSLTNLPDDEKIQDNTIFNTTAGAFAGGAIGERLGAIPAAYKNEKNLQTISKRIIEGIPTKTALLSSAIGAIALGAFGYYNSKSSVENQQQLLSENDKLSAENTILKTQAEWAEKSGRNPDELLSEKATREKSESESEELSL